MFCNSRARTRPCVRVCTIRTALDEWLRLLEALAHAQTRVLVVTGFAQTVLQQLPVLDRLHPRFE